MKGYLYINTPNISKESLEEFRKQWKAQVAKNPNQWKTPIFPKKSGLDIAVERYLK